MQSQQWLHQCESAGSSSATVGAAVGQQTSSGLPCILSTLFLGPYIAPSTALAPSLFLTLCLHMLLPPSPPPLPSSFTHLSTVSFAVLSQPPPSHVPSFFPLSLLLRFSSQPLLPSPPPPPLRMAQLLYHWVFCKTIGFRVLKSCWVRGCAMSVVLQVGKRSKHTR